MFRLRADDDSFSCLWVGGVVRNLQPVSQLDPGTIALREIRGMSPGFREDEKVSVWGDECSNHAYLRSMFRVDFSSHTTYVLTRD
jgi:hypothetical protein